MPVSNVKEGLTRTLTYRNIHILADVAVGLSLDNLLDRGARVELLAGSHIDCCCYLN